MFSSTPMIQIDSGTCTCIVNVSTLTLSRVHTSSLQNRGLINAHPYMNITSATRNSGKLDAGFTEAVQYVRLQ